MDLFERIEFLMKTKREGGYMSPIAQWKLFTEEEEKLAKAADCSIEGKIAYVNYYKENDSLYYQKGLELIDRIIKTFVGDDISKEEYEEFVVDMIYSLHRFGCSFDEYFLYDFPKLNFKGRCSFISDKVRVFLYNQLNLECNHSIFKNKAAAYEIFSRFYGRKLVKIDKDSDFEIFSDFISDLDKFIVKPIAGAMGKSVRIYNKTEFSSEEELFDEIKKIGPVVIEQLIVQDSEMAKFHSDSLNTVRIPVVKSKDQQRVTIFHPFFRMGQGGSVVDNAASGGILADVDADTGIIYTVGCDEKGKQYLTHPDSHYQIVGFKIPRWDEAINLVKEASKYTTNRYIGWDVALTKNGWVIIEGNDCGQFVGQIADKTGRLEELLDLIEE